MAPTVSVRCISPGEDWSGRGPAAWRRLKDTIGADEALRGRQQTGDPYVSVPTSAAVMTFRDAAGRSHLRLLFVMFRGDWITAIIYYQLPIVA
jgi:hypothetical protein